MFGRHRLMDRQGFPRSRRRSIFRVETTKRTPPLWESQFFSDTFLALVHLGEIKSQQLRVGVLLHN